MSEPPASDFVTIVNRAIVAGSVDEVWRRIGGYQDLDLFLDVSCELVAGDGAIGSVRLINGAFVEPMVGMSRHSYTYAQTVGPMSPHAYHGCVACEPSGENSTDIVYTLVYNQTGIEPDKREVERERLKARFSGAVDAMRRIVERHD